MPHCSAPMSVTRDAGDGAQAPRASWPARGWTRAQIASRPQAERIVEGHSQADLAGVVRLPVLEAAGVVADLVADRARSRWRRAGRGRAAPGAGRARGGRRGSRCRAGRAGTCGRWWRACRSRSPRRRPASARPIGRRRADRGCPPARATAPIAGGGIDQAAVGRHVGDGDQLHPLVDHALQRIDRNLAGLVARDHLDHGAGALGDLQEGDDVAGILGAGGQDAVAGGEGDGVEGHVPGAGGVFDEGDLVGVAAEQRRRRVVEALDRVVLAVRRLVAADGRLELEVVDRGVEHGLRHQRGAGVVEMEHVGAPGRLAPRPRHIDRHVPPLGYRLSAIGCWLLAFDFLPITLPPQHPITPSPAP